jgi:hypothetical protein
VQRSDGYPPVQSPAQPHGQPPQQAGPHQGGPPPGWAPPPPPGGFDPLWQPPKEPSGGHRTRNTLIALLVAVLVAGGVTAWLLFRPTDDGGSGTDGGSGSSASSSASESPAKPTPTPKALAAWTALPRSATPLGATKLVVTKEQSRTDFDLFLVDAATGQPEQQLTRAPERDLGPIVSPERKTILYVHEVTANGQTRNEIHAIAPDGNGDKVLVPNGIPGCGQPGRPAWNPVTPTELAVACYDNPTHTALRIISLDGATLHQLSVPARIDDLTFSPDGTQVAFWGSDDPTKQAGHLYTIPTDGSSGPQQLTSSGTDTDPVWGEHGIAFSRATGNGGRQREIFLVDPEDPQPQALTAYGATSQGPAWSPDGSMLAFKSSREGGERFWVMNADGGNLHQVGGDIKAQSTPAWGNR